jgi:hypothetical protein
MMAAILSIALLTSVGAYGAASAMIRRNGTAQNSGPSLFPVYALTIVFIFVFTVAIVNVIGKQKRLLADGEMSMARVADRVLARNGPNIRYDFATPLGEHFSGSAQDGSRKLSVGMTIPVFYDVKNPKKQLALCASFYEVVLPGIE